MSGQKWPRRAMSSLDALLTRLGASWRTTRMTSWSTASEIALPSESAIRTYIVSSIPGTVRIPQSYLHNHVTAAWHTYL